jgi:hypothetical protein
LILFVLGFLSGWVTRWKKKFREKKVEKYCNDNSVSREKVVHV